MSRKPLHLELKPSNLMLGLPGSLDEAMTCCARTATISRDAPWNSWAAANCQGESRPVLEFAWSLKDLFLKRHIRVLVRLC